MPASETIFLPMQMTLETALALKTTLVLAAFVAFALAERIRPAVDSPLLVRLGRSTREAWRRLTRNIGLFAFNTVLSPLIVLPITYWATSFSLGLRPAFLDGWLGFALDILILDLWIYWWHRANHEWPVLWRFHQVHHLDELLDTTSAVRFHFGEVVLSALVRAMVIIALDIDLIAVIVFEALVLTSAIFHHSDARIPDWLERPPCQGDHYAVDPLGASPRDQGGHRQQLRHDLQLLGPALRLEEHDEAVRRDEDRRRADA